ncbi:MAG TPA: penicillin acylase family protein [Micromonosporaceae bacterium]
MWSLGVLLVLLVTASVGGVWAVRRSFPGYAGQVRLPGLSAPVTVYRDRYGIPQVYARTADDLFRAQGYLHAQERFWEMDFRRHVTSGRLAELFGKSQVETDAYLRTMGWRRVAEQEWKIISPDSRRYLTDYADGVNAWLAATGGTSASGVKSLEYTVLGAQNRDYVVERWDPVDSLAWLKAMAWDLRGNMPAEITRAALFAAGLSRARIDELYPPYPFDKNQPIVTGGTVADGRFAATSSTDGAGGGGPATDRDPAAAAAATSTDPATDSALRQATPALRAIGAALAGLPALIGDASPGIGSNSWVLSGRLTATGKPILANDPHLSPSMPGIWYQMGLHCDCPFNVEGFTFSGMPGVIIGHNGRIAWGFTNLNPDVTDLYLEKLDGDRYLVDGQWRDLAVRKETIRVAGSAPVTLTVRTTNNGPLLSDASEELRRIGAKPPVDGTGYGVALRWTALDPGRTVDALFALDAATDWAGFRQAAALFEVPAQNLIYADVDGNIGYQAPGKIPVRGKGDGRWPAPGWDSSYDWKRYLPFDELPSEYNPERGVIVTANQAVIGPTYPRLLTTDWSYGYRSQRISDMIRAAGTGITVADVERMQFDDTNTMAALITPALTSVPLTGFAATAQALLRDWDFREPADGRSGTADARSSAAAAYYNAVWRHLLSRVFDELPAGYGADGGDRWCEVVLNLLQQPDSAWWDERGTPRRETARDEITAAMTDAAAELRHSLGDDPSDWRWGRLHTLTLRNASFGESGIAPIEWLFNYGPAPVSGGSAIVDATGWDAASGGYDVTAVPSMRMVVDLSHLDASRWVQLTGESGHAFSAHYHDQFDLWRTGRTLPMRWDESNIRHEAVDTLTLEP